MITLKINSVAELNATALQLLAFANGHKFFIFEGEMGAGKTTFIKAFCKVLGVADVVSSPTFSIVNEYQGKKDLIYHFDFYRLKTLQEAFDVGYEEYFYSNNYCLLEWPQKIAELLPAEYIKVQIEATAANERTFVFTRETHLSS